jgi:hypothetical protein
MLIPSFANMTYEYGELIHELSRSSKWRECVGKVQGIFRGIFND